MNVDQIILNLSELPVWFWVMAVLLVAAILTIITGSNREAATGATSGSGGTTVVVNAAPRGVGGFLFLALIVFGMTFVLTSSVALAGAIAVVCFLLLAIPVLFPIALCGGLLTALVVWI